MSVFKRSLFTLGMAAFSFSAILLLSIFLFMNSLYYEVNTIGLQGTARALFYAIGEDRITEILIENAGRANIDLDLPVDRNGAYRLTLIVPSGFVLWDSHADGGVENYLARREVASAMEGRYDSTRRNSTGIGMRQLYFALPVFSEDSVVGVFRLSYTVPEFTMRISPILIPFATFAVLLNIALFWGVYMFSRSLSASIGRLVKIAQTGASLLSGSEAGEPIAPEFRSLEKAIRAMTYELNFRLEQAKSEGYRLEAILNGMTEAVFAMDSNLRLHLVNPFARRLFNIGDRDLVSISLLEATRSTELVEAAHKSLSSGSSLELGLTLRSGTEQYFQAYVSPLASKTGVVIVLQDITKLTKLERIRKDFVANVSHELRTPIQLIKGFSETMHDAVSEMEGKIDKKQLIHFIEIIRKNAATMENLTNDLLILADLENNPCNGRDMDEVDIDSIIEEAVFSVEPQSKKKQIEINVECPRSLKARVYGSFVIQALINMIDNAIKYSSPKSKVWVSAHLTENSDKEGSGKELVLQVRDKGIGIPSEHLERIFERFYRVDRSRSREAGGTGLGLSIVRHIAMLHKGKVEAESHAEGSVFRIKLPQP